MQTYEINHRNGGFDAEKVRNGAVKCTESAKIHFCQPSIQQRGVPKCRYLFEPFIVQGTINLWAGEPGVGKSIIATSVAIHLAALYATDEEGPKGNLLAIDGKNEWCGLPINKPPGRVLYVTEETEEEIDIRWCRLLNSYDLNEDQRMQLNGGFFVLTFDELRRCYKHEVAGGIAQEAERYEAGLVVIDTVGHLIGGNINDYHIISQTYDALRPILNSGRTLLLLDHVAKRHFGGEDKNQEELTPIGSAQKMGQARHVTTIRRIERVKTEDPRVERTAVRLEVTKSNRTKTGQTAYLDLVFDDSIDSQWVEQSPTLRGLAGEIFELLQERGEMQLKNIAEELGEGLHNIKRRLAELYGKGYVIKPKHGWYALKTAGDNREGGK
jgi:Mn-dependent DtxR family transcriptional regulator